jgi:hypothetical protein
LGVFTEGSLGFGGIYISIGERKKPPEADPVSMIGAGVLLALASRIGTGRRGIARLDVIELDYARGNAGR